MAPAAAGSARAVGLLLATASLADAHLFTQCPQPRQCRLWHPSSPGEGESWQAGADGPVSQNPCGFPAADVPPTTLVAGDTFCFRVYEYVPHTGSVMKVDLSLYPEGPLGEPANFNLHLSSATSNGEDETAVSAGTHGVEITVPDITCDRCTLRAEQWATDLQVYYWTCADVRIVRPSAERPIGSSDCRTRITKGTCEEWLPVGQIPSMKVTGMIIWGLVAVSVAVISGAVAAVNGLCCCKGTSKLSLPEDDCGAKLVSTVKRTRCWLPIVAPAVALVATGLVLFLVLRSCSYGWQEDWENL